MYLVPLKAKGWRCGWRFFVLSDLMEEFLKTVNALIALGGSRQEYVPEILAERDEAWRILMCGNDPWRRLGQRLREVDLISLIRGLVVYGRVSGRSTGGSVSPVIALYCEFADRFPTSEPSLTAWIITNRTNEFEPFGSTINNDQLSLESHRQEQRARAAAARANEARDQARQAEEGQAKRIKEAENATANLRNAVRRGDLAAVKALLDKGADVTRAMPNGESLVALAHEYGRGAVADFLITKGIR